MCNNIFTESVGLSFIRVIVYMIAYVMIAIFFDSSQSSTILVKIVYSSPSMIMVWFPRLLNTFCNLMRKVAANS